MDTDALRTVVEAIPKGRWMSYADVVVAAGGRTTLCIVSMQGRRHATQLFQGDDPLWQAICSR